MAAAAYGQGRDKEPPPLVRAAAQHGSVERAEFMAQPAELAQRMKMLNYIYRCFKSYANAGQQQQTVRWAEQYPEQWDVVTRVMQMRRERGH